MKRSYSTTELAKMWDVSESTIKRWADAGMLKCRKTVGGHRKFDLEGVNEFQAKTGLFPCKFSIENCQEHVAREIARIESLIAVSDFSTLKDTYRQAALGGRCDLTSTMLRLATQQGISFIDIIEKIIRPAMMEIGEMWRAGKVQVYEEHLATFATIQALSEPSATLSENSDPDQIAIVGCSESEIHQMASLIVGRVLEEAGWSVIDMGPHTPLFSFADAINRLKPGLVCISITMIDNLERAARDYDVLRRAASANNTKIILGGKALSDEGARTRFQGAAYATDLYELMEILQKL